jgi:putative ABC transport system permease protein
MIKNYLHIALRNLKKQKAYSAITISGLTIGLAVFVLFALLNEFISSYDAFHQKGDRIYAVVQVLPGGVEGELHSAITPAPLMPALKSEIPEIEAASRFFPAGRMIVKHQDKIFYETRVRFVDPGFLNIFTFKTSKGNPDESLSRPYSMVLTESAALKYFGDEDPIGQTLTLDNKVDVRVTGVTEDVPRNSTIYYDFLVSMETAPALYPWMEDWKRYNQATFLLLAEGNSPAQVEARFSTLVGKYFPVSPDAPVRMYLHPLQDFFFNSAEIDCVWGTGGANFVVLWIIAVLLLAIACINYMNLSTARHITRAREVGMRKVVGAHRSHLIRQFLGESLLMSLLTLPLVIVLYEVFRPAMVSFFDFILDMTIWDNPRILVIMVTATVLTGLFAGSYPAFYLSSFKPVRVLKGNLHFGKKGGGLRKTLVVVQFVFSIVLIVLTIISIKQTRHNFRVDLGFDREQIVAVEIAEGARENLENYRATLTQYQDITTVSASAALPVGWDPERQVLPEGASGSDRMTMNVYDVDYDFVEILDMEILRGRSFSRNFSDEASFILNETAVRQLQWQENPLGRRLTIDEEEGTVVGVVKDFHFKDLYFVNITPAVIRLKPERNNYMLVRYAGSGNEADVVSRIQESWNVFNPDLPFEQVSLSGYFEDSFEGDKTAEMTGALGILAIVLSCMGLLGLSSFAVERKIKEIGIRKVLGASVSGIIKMLSKEFLKLVVIANIIALPIGYFLMNMMIKFMFSYPMTIGPDIFIFTALITLVVAFVTVTSQTLRAAHASPVDSLKYE